MNDDYDLIIFDKDGTLVQPVDHGERDGPPNKVDEQRLYLDVLPRLTQLRLDTPGVRLAIATNQGGVAFGYMTLVEAQMLLIHAKLLTGVAAAVMCPHHPQGTVAEYAIRCDCRKPEPGMLHDLLDLLDTPLERALFVGDRQSDEDAAVTAGIAFEWAESFFNREPPDADHIDSGEGER